jgi:hypothetical protein
MAKQREGFLGFLWGKEGMLNGNKDVLTKIGVFSGSVPAGTEDEMFFQEVVHKYSAELRAIQAKIERDLLDAGWAAAGGKPPKA